jgi:hypothetical protein
MAVMRPTATAAFDILLFSSFLLAVIPGRLPE